MGNLRRPVICKLPSTTNCQEVHAVYSGHSTQVALHLLHFSGRSWVCVRVWMFVCVCERFSNGNSVRYENQTRSAGQTILAVSEESKRVLGRNSIPHVLSVTSFLLLKTTEATTSGITRNNSRIYYKDCVFWTDFYPTLLVMKIIIIIIIISAVIVTVLISKLYSFSYPTHHTIYLCLFLCSLIPSILNGF